MKQTWKAKQLAGGPLASKWQSQGLDPSLLTAERMI